MDLKEVKIWQQSDLNGFFGLFTNNVTNILVLTGLLLYAAKMPEILVFGRILPAVGLGIFLSSLFYFWQGYKMAKKEGRDTVTALPSGISVPHMFLIIFMIVLPVNQKTGNATLAWQTAMAWCLIEGVVECSGAVLGKFIRRVIPRAALLGSLAGMSITYIMVNGSIQSWEVAYISFASFAVILLGFIAKKKMPFGIPVGLAAILLGTVLGWISGYMDTGGLTESFATVGFYPPMFAGLELFRGFDQVIPFIIAAIPMGIYNFVESIDNLESAAVAGDRYDTTKILLADGVTSIISSLFGGIVPTAVYIGHPGWKSAGARLGYSWMTGVVVLLICVFGVESILINLIPVAALLPILIYIGMLIGAQSFEHIPVRHFPAVMLGIMPCIGEWGKGMINNAVVSAGGVVTDIPLETFAQNGIYYRGFEVLGCGAILIGIIWASLMVYLVERKQKQAVLICLAAAGLTFFGIIHAPSVGVGKSMGVVAGYLIVALIVLAGSRQGYTEEL